MVDLWVVEQRVDPLAALALERPAALGAARVDTQPAQSLGSLSARCFDGELGSVGRRPLDHDDARVDEVAQACRGELEELAQVSFSDERLGDLVQ